MSELAQILSKAQTIEPYEPTIRDNLRNSLRNLLGGGRGAQDFSDRLIGTELPKTPLGGLVDMVPGISTAMDVEEGSRAWDQGRGVDAALHMAGPAMDAAGVGLALNSPGGRRAVGNFVNNQAGSVPIGFMSNTPPIADDLGMTMQEKITQKTLAELKKIELEHFAVSDLPTGVRRDVPIPQTPSIADDLGMSDRLYHYTGARPEDVGYLERTPLDADPPFEAFDPDKAVSDNFDALGPHAGTFTSAVHRGRAVGGSPTVRNRLDPDDLERFPDLARVPEDKHPKMHGQNMVIVPHHGQVLELAADTSKPFTVADARMLAKDLGVSGREHYWENMVGNTDTTGKLWSETQINSFIDEVANAKRSFKENPMSQRQAVQELRQELAARGYTDVPYINDVEDAGSTSHVMLTDRPADSKAVLRDRRAKFDPLKKNLPNLMAGVGGAALLPREPELEYGSRVNTSSVR